MMLEVPGAALCIDTMLDEVDFVCIGSNDLVQYLMAADRDNPKVAHLCEPFNPALLRLLSQVIRACNAPGKPVTLCGEMAGRPRCSCRCSAWACAAEHEPGGGADDEGSGAADAVGGGRGDRRACAGDENRG